MQTASGFYARSLRAIGQDLAGLVVESLAIEVDGDEFIVNGLCSKAKSKPLDEKRARTGVKKLVDNVTDIIYRPDRGPEWETVPFSRTYDRNNIGRLDDEGSKHRGNHSDMPDIYTLGERLRTIGKIIDAQNGGFVKIFKHLNRIIFEFRDPDGEGCNQKLSNIEFYRLQQRYAAGRADSNTPKRIQAQGT